MFNWDEERLKNKDFLEKKKKTKELNNFNTTMLELFCNTYNLPEEEAMLHWTELKDDFLMKFSN